MTNPLERALNTSSTIQKSLDIIDESLAKQQEILQKQIEILANILLPK